MNATAKKLSRALIGHIAVPRANSVATLQASVRVAWLLPPDSPDTPATTGGYFLL